MDHLPKAEGAFLPAIEIPLLCEDNHQFTVNSDYFTFLEEQGLETRKLAEGAYSLDRKEFVLSTIQSWGFFGTLIAIFKIVRVPLDVSHFIRVTNDREPIVTTTHLHSYLRIWIYHERKRLPTATKVDRGEKIKEVLQTLSQFIDNVLDHEMQGIAYSSQALINNPDQASTSGRLMLRAMQTQFECSGGYHEFSMCIDDDYYSRHLNFFSGPMCGKGYQYEKDGLEWHSQSMSPAHLLILSLSLLGEALESARSICYGDDETIHFKGPMFVQALMQHAGWCPVDVRRVAEGSDVSVLNYLINFDRRSTWEQHMGCCPNEGCLAYQITDSSYEGRHTTPDSWTGGASDTPLRFVAISHIWADGIGNTKENAIPQCQLKKLQREVDRLYECDDDYKPGTPFWIDTLMIPLEPSAKAKAISGMDQVYRSADKVLVLDASLEAVSTQRDPQELMMRISICPWMSRLWTLQEAFLARHLFFKFEDKSLEIEDLIGLLRHKLLGEDAALIETTHTVLEVEDEVGYTYTRALEAMLTDRLVAYVENDGKITEHDDDVNLHPVRTFAMNRLLWIRLNAWNLKKMEDMRATGDFSFGQVAVPMHYRASSKSEDEPLCLALIAGISVHGLMQIPPEERMEQFFGQFDEIPGNIIFSEKQRIDKPARRWIPQSLLNSSNFYGGPPGHPTANGLVVQFGGVLLKGTADNTLFPCRHTAPEGLFYIKYQDTWLLCKFQAKHYQLIPEQDTKDDYHGSEFEYLNSHSDFNYGHWILDGSALLFDVQNVMLEFCGERNAAFVHLIRGQSIRGEIIETSFVLAMKIWNVATEKTPLRNDLHVIEATDVLDQQMWCVG